MLHSAVEYQEWQYNWMLAQKEIIQKCGENGSTMLILVPFQSKKVDKSFSCCCKKQKKADLLNEDYNFEVSNLRL